MNPKTKTLLAAIYRLYEHSGFSLAGAVAFSFVVSLFPFCIFLGAIAGVLGGRELANEAISQLFHVLPDRVAQGLAPEVEAIMTNSRIDLLTFGAFVALFFATSAIETLRAALNGAYRVRETRPYLLSLLISTVFVLVSAISMLVLTWAVVVGPRLAARFDSELTSVLLNSSWIGTATRYSISAAVIGLQLIAFHLWLAAGRRSLRQVLPGVALSTFLWLLTAALYSYYLNLNDYARFYAGLSQLMVALIFFQVTAIIIILGAELNRGLIELGVIESERDEDVAGLERPGAGNGS